MFHSGLSEGSLPAPTIPSEVSTTAAMETETTSTADEMQKAEGIVETEATLTVDVEQEKEGETEETTERAIENDPIVKIDPDQEISAQEDQVLENDAEVDSVTDQIALEDDSDLVTDQSVVQLPDEPVTAADQPTEPSAITSEDPVERDQPEAVTEVEKEPFQTDAALAEAATEAAVDVEEVQEDEDQPEVGDQDEEAEDEEIEEDDVTETTSEDQQVIREPQPAEQQQPETVAPTAEPSSPVAITVASISVDGFNVAVEPATEFTAESGSETSTEEPYLSLQKLFQDQFPVDQASTSESPKRRRKVTGSGFFGNEFDLQTPSPITIGNSLRVSDKFDEKPRSQNGLNLNSDLDDQILFDPLEETVDENWGKKEAHPVANPVSPIPEQVNVQASFEVAAAVWSDFEAPDANPDSGAADEDEEEEEEEYEDDGPDPDEVFEATTAIAVSGLDDVVLNGVEESLGIVVPDEMKLNRASNSVRLSTENFDT